MIVGKDNPILRGKAQDVAISQIKSEKIANIISRMKTAMDSQEDGVAIACPQIGEPLNIFLISEKAVKAYIERTGSKISLEHFVFINPKITYVSKKKIFMEEGCLSVRYLYGKVKRSVKARIEAYDENGEKFEIEGSGLIAQILQHETDHLNGELFIDKAIDIVDMPPKKK